VRSSLTNTNEAAKKSENVSANQKAISYKE